MDERYKLSCIDCYAIGCGSDSGRFPEFCPTKHKLTEEDLNAVKKIYAESDNECSMIAAAEVDSEGYCQLTRIEEIIQYAQKIGAKKLGIAACMGLISEARTLAKILRYHGFAVYGVGCKIGCIEKTDIGIPEKCNINGCITCNPIMQAKLLNEAKTDLNIVVGLCVGHDSMFYKYIDGLTTTAVTKDRVLGHNPVAALYGADGYFKKRLYPPKNTDK